MLVSFISNNVKKSRLMFAGNLLQAVGYFVLGPSPLFFDRSLPLVGVGLCLFGFSAGFLYGKHYLVPSMPHMIEVAHKDYNYKEDHRLNDTLSAIANISLCIGEITGPIVSSLLCDAFGFSTASTIVGFGVLVYAIIYLGLSDVLTKENDKEESLVSELIEM